MNYLQICVIILLSLTSEVFCSCKEEYKTFSGTHTACLEPNKSCKTIRTGITDNEKEEILAVHNAMREKIASGSEMKKNKFLSAANMVFMEWDDELAEVAQAHADQCDFEHDCNECREVDSYSTGQNLFQRFSTQESLKANWTLALQSYYNEINIADPGLQQNFSGGAWGHFTQVVWAKSWKVGCGYDIHKATVRPFKVEELYTCNYGPSGNIINEPMYIAGDPASKCPLNTKPTDKPYASLCKSLDESGPQDENTTDIGIIFFCNFESDENCGLKINDTTLVSKRKIVSGHYLRLLLKADQSVQIGFPEPIKSKDGFCIEINQRKGATKAENEAANELKAKLDIPIAKFTTEIQVGLDYNEWSKSDVTVEWGYKTLLSFIFSVPSNVTQQYFDLRKILIYSGKCKTIDLE